MVELTGASKSILSRLSNVAYSRLGRVKVAATGALSTVGVTASAVSDLLGGGLVAFCRDVSLL